jgi:hypothetical protein
MKSHSSLRAFLTGQDFFYVCSGHLKDKGFCTAIVDQEAVAAKKKREMDAEIERVKQEFEEKQRKKKEKEKEKEKEREKEKIKDEDKEKEKEKEKDEKKPSSIEKVRLHYNTCPNQRLTHW